MDAAPALSRKTEALVAMGGADKGAFVANLETRISALPTSQGAIPLTINDGGGRTCYVCCPSAAYVDYALAELRHFEGRGALKAGLTGLIGAGDLLLRVSGIDRHVQPGNWLLATNLGPALDAGELTRLTRDLVDRYPRHAVVWRSLNTRTDAERLRAHEAAGYELFPARQVYLFDCRGAPPPRHRDERRDEALLEQGDYAVVDAGQFGTEDFVRAAELYGLLYLRKYTPLNPQYSAEFIARAVRSELLAMAGLRNGEGRLDGVIGFFAHGDSMSAPIVGYDTTLPQGLGLYRRLMAIGMRRARAERLLYNMSAGAAGFKRNRGAVPAIEYAAVYMRHLSFPRRMAAGMIRTVLARIGETLLTRFEL